MKKIRDWFRSTKTRPLSSHRVSTVPLSEDQIPDGKSPVTKFQPQQILYACGQSEGKQRDHNEDHLLAFTISVGGEGSNFPCGFLIVCDGMGGHQFGEVASSVAVRTMAGYLIRKFHPYILNPTGGMDTPLQDLMRSAIHEAHRSVAQAAPGSGTTVTAALILGQQVTIGHVGDSRAYVILPDGRIDPITRDHTLVKRLEELGQLSSGEANLHPQRNVLYRALGQGDFLEADIFTTPFPQPGYLLFCSDGLWSVISEEEIVKIINKSPTLQAACQEMVQAANNAGGPDNISVILAQLIG